MKFANTSKLLSVYSLFICCPERKFTILKTIHIYKLSILFLFLSGSIDVDESFAQFDKRIQPVNENSIPKSKFKKTDNTTGEVEQEWVAIYSGVGGLKSDEATDIVVDSFGNVHVTGYSQGLSYDYDCATIKYNTHGEVLWISRYDGGYDDYAYKLALDDSGNVYITGSSYSTGTGEDYLTIKYNTDGVEQWVRKYNGPGNSIDKANELTIDNIGNVYVTGESNGSGTYSDYATIKYTSDGMEQWVNRYNGPVNSYDKSVAIAIDDSYNILVTGRSIGLNYHYNFATLKYSTDGAEIWVKRFSFFGNYSDWPNDITVDNQMNVIITGTGASLDSTSFAPDYLTIKYDSTGNEQWTVRYNGPGNDFDEAKVVAVDDSGNIYITGWSIGEGGRQDYATIKYNHSGTEQWVSRFNGGFVSDLVLDNMGNVYVTGDSFDSTTIGAYTTIKYDTYGVQQWFVRYIGPGGYDVAKAIALDESITIYITGITYVPGGIPTFDYATVKYKQRIVPVELTNLTGSVTDSYVILNWQTAIETNNSGFEVERLQDSEIEILKDWKTVGFVPGYGTTTELKSYMFVDNDVSSGVYYYRLKQIDFDGSFEYSNIVEILFSSPMTFSLEQNYPNPFNPTTTIKYSLPKVSNVKLTIYDILGRVVATIVNEPQQHGSYEINWDASNVSSGVYFYQLKTKDYVDTKKMILLK